MKILEKPHGKKQQTLYKWIAIIPVFLLTIYSCNNKNIDDRIEKLLKDKGKPCGIIINYPKNGTIFPPEISTPEFSWQDTMISLAKWHICILTPNGKKLFTKIVRSANWRPDSLLWKTIKTSSIQEPLLFTIVGESKWPFKKKYTSGKICFSTSRDSVGASVLYRAVPLPFSYAVKNVIEIEWYIGNIEGSKPRKILDKMPVCANCHSFSKDASILAMDVDYANDKGSYVISPIKDTTNLTIDKIITWSDYKRADGEYTFGLLSQISPDGKYVLSTVKDRSVFVPVDNLNYSQLFFPIKGIIAVYDRETKKYYELPGACNKDYVQSNPNWSPDGTEVIFARSKRYYSSKIEKFSSIMLKPEDAEEFVSRKKNFKFDLYRLDFNKGKGGEAKPIPGASNNNKSNYFARYSPDGKWIVFCQAENFMLLQKDSKLYIMPAEGGKPRLMNCNMDNMNSWHSWSPNGKWLVFSSKNKGPYTQLYLTHIDENGNDSPPVLLKNLSFNKKAANIPEFFASGKNKLSKIVDAFSLSAFYYTSRAKEFIIRKDYKTALENLEMAINLDSTYLDAYYNRIQVNLTIGQASSKNDLSDKKIALLLIEKQLQQKPNDESLLNEIVELRFMSDDINGALKDGMKLLEKNPKNYKVFAIVSEIYRNNKQYQNAVPFYEKMLKTYPDDKDVIYYSALCYQGIKKFEKALNLFNKLINNYPKESEYYIARANLFEMKGDAIAAKSDYDRAVLLDQKNYKVYKSRGEFFYKNGKPELAKFDFEKAISLLSADIEKDPDDIELLVYRSQIMEQSGSIEGAIADCDKLLKISPLNYMALKYKAELETSLQHWQNTIDVFNLIIENFPPEAEVFYKRGFAYLQLGKKSQALADIDKALHLEPDNSIILFNRAMLKKEMGYDAAARKELEKLANSLNNKKKKGELNNEEIKILDQINYLLNNK